MIAPSTDKIKDMTLNDTHRLRRFVSLLSYAGLTLSQVAGLKRCHFRHTPPRLPGVTSGKGLSADQAQALVGSLDGVPARDRGIVLLSLFCGLRQVEIRRLRFKDVIHTDSGRVYLQVQGKGGKNRVVYVPESVLRGQNGLLSDLGTKKNREGVSCVFASPTGHDAPLSDTTVRNIIDSYLKPISGDATAHCLRHTLVTALLNTGASLQEAMEIAGHSEASSHELYAAADDGWFIRSWQESHPLASWKSEPGVSHVYVPGKPRGRKMNRNTERVVPVPMWVIREYSEEIEILSEGEWTSKRLSKMYDALEYSPSVLREAGAVHMAERGAHPFLLSLVLGVTPDWVLTAKYERRGPDAEMGRIQAIERAVEKMNGRKINERRVA